MKVTVVYHADKGDSKVVEWGAFTFFDGVPVEIEDNEANAHMLGKIQINRFFEVTGIGQAKSVPVEPEVYPEETPDDDPESEPEDQAQEDSPQPEGSPFKDYVPAKEKTAKARSDNPRAKPKRGRR